MTSIVKVNIWVSGEYLLGNDNNTWSAVANGRFKLLLQSSSHQTRLTVQKRNGRRDKEIKRERKIHHNEKHVRQKLYA